MVPPFIGQALFFAIATAMGIWMTAYVHLQVLIHGKGILVPQNRTVPNDFYNAMYGNHSHVTVGNISFHYVANGCDVKDNRTVLLLLHGFLDFWYIWNRLTPELGKDFCVVAPDLRGYGNTTRPNDTADYLMKHLIKDVKGLVEEFSNNSSRKVVLVGHDWGGMMSFCFATVYEKLIHRMIIINGMHPRAFTRQLFRSVKQMRMSWYQLPFRRPVVPENYLILNDLAFLDKVHKGFTQEEKYAHKYIYSQPGALTGTINYYRAFNNDSDQFSKIPFRKINVTTLILWGEHDEFIMTRVAFYNQYWLSNSVAIYYEGAGHFPQRECPNHVIGRIREFAKHGNVSIPEENRWWLQRYWQSRDHCRESRKPRGTWIHRAPPFIPDNAKLPKEMLE
ncbi:epoxide hydrolase 4 [Rhipicephalus microplus]|uniref:epoxide hydrolase 4 n=1 Tax=Rhipicephalus microplus TaxID=6941 RepID=UPI003F6D48FE